MTIRRSRGTVRAASLLAVAAAAVLSLTACQTGGDDDTGPDGKAGAVITRSIGDGVTPDTSDPAVTPDNSGTSGADIDRVSVVLGSADVISAHT
ncbi:hypothetical protein AB0C93_13365 [Streptomyces sp. NPDC048518]|uniref:hypothetical protein n=1 Tax=Streptomyces sp. NPDC048518 TaxID=3155029 RepID=UPI00340C0BB8